MNDGDPVPTRRDANVALPGDPAHAMYPSGSNGALQAAIDARVPGASMIERRVTTAALGAHDARLCGLVAALILRNRCPRLVSLHAFGGAFDPFGHGGIKIGKAQQPRARPRRVVRQRRGNAAHIARGGVHAGANPLQHPVRG